MSDIAAEQEDESISIKSSSSKRRPKSARSRQGGVEAATPGVRMESDSSRPQSPPMDGQAEVSISGEAMVGQEEIDFPTTTERTSSRPKSGSSRRKDKNGFEEKEFTSLNPRDYGIDYQDEEERIYEPPKPDGDLPDLYRLMASLEEAPGGATVGLKDGVPSLFNRPENVTSYKKITELKMQMEEEAIGDYVGQFEDGVRDDVLMIGSIALEDVQEEEKRLRDEHVRYLETEATLEEERKRKLRVQEEATRKRLAKELWQRRLEIQRNEQLLLQREHLMLDRLQKSFRRSENQLVGVLDRRKGEVKTYYGDLMTAEGHYGGSQGRRWKVDWDKTPQPIQVKLSCLRGVKDKLPAGRYVLMVSLYNRLGGHVMRWSNLKGQQWGGATLPVTHDGQFYNVEVKLDQSVFTVLPARPGIKPGMMLMFELFLLRGAVVPTDRVVGWGTFPIADGLFDVVEGKFKCPLLRGEIDHRIDRHEKLEGLMASDLDHWLSNLYFEVVKLPRYLAGQKEYEVELQFSSGILAYPDRVNTGEEYRDGEAPVAGSLVDLKTDTDTPNMTSSDMSLGTQTFSSAGDSDRYSTEKKPLPYENGLDEKKRLDSPEVVKEPGEIRRRPMSTIGSRTVNKDRKVKVGEDSEDSDYEEDDVYLMKKDTGFYPVRGQPGMFYKKHEFNPVDHYHKKMYSLLPRTPLLNMQRRKRRKLTHLERLEEHSFSVNGRDDQIRVLSEKGRLPRKAQEKVDYVRRQLLAELGLSQWRSREFWGMLVMFIIVFFLRIYIHYLSQWIFLQALELPVNRLDFLPYTVNLNYQNTLLRTRQEIGMVLLGPGGNILIFLLLVLITWTLQRTLGAFPDVGSKFILAFGIQAFLDPFLILAVDCILGRYQNLGGIEPIADFAKLYWHFDLAQGSGLGGIFITIFLYSFTCFAAGAILYMYFLRLHNNGRMLDIYWRLHGEEDIFFVPYDLELSNQELSYIHKKADQWRGEEGERRKTSVYDYIWEEEAVEELVWDENGSEVKVTKEGKKEITTHVSVHVIHLDGLRELYRHFLRLPDGGIIEVFGDMSVAGMDKDIKSALTEGAATLENLEPTDGVSRIPGRQSAMTVNQFHLDDDEDVDQSEGSAGSLPRKGKVE